MLLARGLLYSGEGTTRLALTIPEAMRNCSRMLAGVHETTRISAVASETSSWMTEPLE